MARHIPLAGPSGGRQCKSGSGDPGRPAGSLPPVRLVAPAVEEVVLVEESFADAQAEVGKLHFMRVVAEPETARVGNAVFPTVDDEAVQVLVAPTQGDLEGGVEVGDAAVAADKESAPDQGADAAQHDAELVDEGTSGRR